MDEPLRTQPMVEVVDNGGNIVSMSYLNPRYNVSAALMPESGLHANLSSGRDDR